MDWVERRSDAAVKSYCRISKIMAVCCSIIAVYNSSLRGESGYMAYFVMAIPFALAREGQNRKAVHAAGDKVVGLS